MAGPAWARTPVTERLGIDWPIIQAPMAGGPTTPELVAAVSNAGGLGMLSTGYLGPEQVREAIRRVRALTARPFGANLLVPEAVAIAEPELARAFARLAPFKAELGLAAGAAALPAPEPFAAQAAVLIEEGVPVVSFTFAMLPGDLLAALKARGTVVVGTATTVAEAVALEQAGVDLIVGQGSEAGGHRGTFLGSFDDALIGTMALIPQLADAVAVPVVAAGGIMDGRGLAAALALGAGAAQMGTAFLLSDESGANAPYRAALAQTTDESTCITRAFSGKPVRAIGNRFIRELAGHPVPAYPIQHALTRELRAAAVQQGETGLMGMWAGQGSRLARSGPASALMAAWLAQADAVLARLGSLDSISPIG